MVKLLFDEDDLRSCRCKFEFEGIVLKKQSKMIAGGNDQLFILLARGILHPDSRVIYPSTTECLDSNFETAPKSWIGCSSAQRDRRH